MRRSLRIVCVVSVIACAVSTNVAAQSVTVQKLASQGAGDGPGGGDLRLTEGCKVDINGDGWISGWLNIQVAGQPISDTYFEYYLQGSIQSTQVYTTVPTSNSNRNVDCWASTSWGYYQLPTWTLPGSGPGTALFKIAAFILQNWVGTPFPYRILGGDDRPFTSNTGASHRILDLIRIGGRVS